MDKLAIDTEANLALKFSTALGRYDDKEALRIFKSASSDPTGMQISKEKEMFYSGEWESRDKLQICLITGSHCNGHIGST